jgi:hypothetical protein
MFLMLSITYGLVLLWNPPTFATLAFAFVGITASVKFVANDSEEADRKSFRWYEVMHSCHNIFVGAYSN